MKKKILGVLASLFIVAILALPMSTVFATKSEELTGEIWMLPLTSGGPYDSARQCGKSNTLILTFNGLPMVISGEIIGSGVYDGKWIGTLDPFGINAANGWYLLDVEIGELSGQLTIRALGLKLTIISGTGDLANIHGTGRIVAIPDTMETGYTYSLNVHFDP